MTMEPSTVCEIALASAGREHGMLIGGEITPARGGAAFTVRDPATSDGIGMAPDASGEDVDRAIDAADAARGGWAGCRGAERVAVVRAMADIVEANLDEIAALDSFDTGVPFWMMRADVATGIQRMRMFADWALRLAGETIPSTLSHLTYTERVPFGVVARIVAYNHPAMFGISKIAAPLIAGNSVILKPSELTPMSMLRLGELWAEVVPAGVLSIITGRTAAPGQQLVADPRVRRVAFTGSPETGRAIQRTAAENAVKSVSLELGGKNALVVLEDANLDMVVEGATRGMNLAFAGQSCGSTSRLLASPAILAELVPRLIERFDALTIGGPFEAGVQVGPLITDVHLARVGRRVTDGLAAGAQLVTGGEHAAVPDQGYFYRPTILRDADAGSWLAQEEIFGPVLTVIPVESVDRAVAIANSVRYGLTASVYGRDLAAALAVARQTEAGYVWVNDTSTHFAGIPFGGVKDSGVGREESVEELFDYTQIRATSVRIG
ncbi:MAG: aldehyde dehydrogenase family protein [Streptosporangiaceae bacterium]